MLTKLLVTIGVIIACIWLVSARRDRPQPKIKAIVSKEVQERQKLLRRGAWSFMALMVLAAVIMIAVELQDKNALVTVHVINTQSGERISYQARREDVEQNSFTTVSGRKIFTAGVERIEIEAPPE